MENQTGSVGSDLENAGRDLGDAVRDTAEDLTGTNQNP